MSEIDLQRGIMDSLAKLGIWAIRTGVAVKRSNRGTSSGVPGMPDIYLPGLGHIEVKQPGHTLSPRQVMWHEKAAKEGVKVATVFSVAEAVETALRWKQERLGQKETDRQPGY
jgi:hypothetical protein